MASHYTRGYTVGLFQIVVEDLSPSRALLKNVEWHGKTTIKNHVQQLGMWTVSRYRWRTIIDQPKLRQGSHYKPENTLDALENVLPVIDSIGLWHIVYLFLFMLNFTISRVRYRNSQVFQGCPKLNSRVITCSPGAV